MIPATMILGKGMGHTTSQHQDLDLLKLKLVGRKEPETSPSRNNCWAFSCRISKRLIFYQKRKHQLQGWKSFLYMDESYSYLVLVETSVDSTLVLLNDLKQALFLSPNISQSGWSSQRPSSLFPFQGSWPHPWSCLVQFTTAVCVL